MRHLFVSFGLFALMLCCASSTRATGLGYLTTQNSSTFPSSSSEPIKFDVFHVPADRSSSHLLHELTVEVLDFHSADPIGPVPIILSGSDNGSDDDQGSRFPGTLGMMIARLAASPDGDFPNEVSFDILILANVHDRFGQISEAKVIIDSETHFDVQFDVVVNSLAAHTASFSLPDDQPLLFVSPQVVPNNSGVHVQGILRRTDGLPMQDLFSVEFHGHFIPEPTSLALLAWGGWALISWRRQIAS